jgi:uncharacterized protein (DUF433 family)
MCSLKASPATFIDELSRLDRIEYFEMTDTAYRKLLKRVVVKRDVCGGEPCILGTRINVAVILDSLAEGLSPKEITEHFPPLTELDIRAAVAYAAELARKVSAA